MLLQPLGFRAESNMLVAIMRYFDRGGDGLEGVPHGAALAGECPLGNVLKQVMII